MFLLNSCLSLFSAARSLWHPLSRSYWVILPSSLTMLLPPALGFSPHPPVSVYGTGTWYTIAAFLGSRNRTLPYLCSVRVTDSDHETDLPVSLLPCLPGALFPGCAVLLRPHSSDTMRYRNLNLLSIGYALKPRLRPRLTQTRSALLWKPWMLAQKQPHIQRVRNSSLVERILTSLSLLIPAFSLLKSPQLLTGTASLL